MWNILFCKLVNDISIFNTEDQNPPGGWGLGHNKVRSNRKNIHLLDTYDLLDCWPDPEPAWMLSRVSCSNLLDFRSVRLAVGVGWGWSSPVKTLSRSDIVAVLASKRSVFWRSSFRLLAWFSNCFMILLLALGQPSPMGIPQSSSNWLIIVEGGFIKNIFLIFLKSCSCML